MIRRKMRAPTFSTIPIQLASLGVLALSIAIATSGTANAAVVINEYLGSTPGADVEFIELHNTGPGNVDISGWSIELWESDFGVAVPPGALDGASPYVIPAATTLNAGAYYLLAGPDFFTDYPGLIGLVNQALPANAIENSSFTMVLRDAGAVLIDSLWAKDGDPGDFANDGTSAIVPNITLGPDGNFMTPGGYRQPDGATQTSQFQFSRTPGGATPGSANLVPEPSSLALAGIGLVALVGLMRRRRKN